MRLARVAAMCIAIHFDDQPGGNTGKIRNIGPNRMLPPEFVARKIAVP
jgi:hypothetical protein